MAVPEDSLTGTIEDLVVSDDRVRLRVRLTNRADRPLHVIAGVRALDFDPDAARLTVRLHDEGRRVVPGAANVTPKTQFVDPDATADITVDLPAEITKLAPPPEDDPTKVVFVKHRIADATTVDVELGWADVPYYEDPRPTDSTVLPSVLWQQHRLTARYER